MRLSAPTSIVFIVTVVIAIVAALAALNIIPNVPLASVWIMAVAYVVLALACLLKGA
jgi:hypothetical protein